MNLFGKPVIIIGHGMRAAGVDCAPLLELGVPILSSWQGADLVDNWHPNYMGRPGIYGQRCANKVLYEADHIISLGTRMCAWMIGHGGLRPEQKLTMVDVDMAEMVRAKATPIQMELSTFMEKFQPMVQCYSWLKQCQRWKDQWDWVEYPTHDDTNGYVNSYQFIRRLEPHLAPDQIIVTDNGSVMCPAFQALRLKPTQRLLTAGNLGEMGCALPGAIGAAFGITPYGTARNVIALIGDGGMMMNIQELATIRKHNLHIKMIVFENDGYSMIKGTYDNVKKQRVGVSDATGLKLPDFVEVAKSFGIHAERMTKWDEFDAVIQRLLGIAGPMLLELKIDPEQVFLPRLKPIIRDGKITPAKFDELSPINA